MSESPKYISDNRMFVQRGKQIAIIMLVCTKAKFGMRVALACSVGNLVHNLAWIKREGCNTSVVIEQSHWNELLNTAWITITKGKLTMPQQMVPIKDKNFLKLAQSFYCTACGVQPDYPCLIDMPKMDTYTRVHRNRNDSAYEFRRLHNEQNYGSGQTCSGCKWCDILLTGLKEENEAFKKEWNKTHPATIQLTPNGASTIEQREKNAANVLDLISQGLTELNNASNPSRSVVVLSTDYRISLTIVDDGLNIHLKYRTQK